ncbi:hypothetical protein J2777_002979 [Paraburkholderia graminis]|uniref:hypothetical protein n=1 Tax=Paraburkholderia graminis TaxID=60548 RepID=UPI002863C7B9|nr:hypothetical protein [Paraburkholderia graminis]MDR6469251.1 hypothetical protein [Paraburkholderia graminis]
MTAAQTLINRPRDPGSSVDRPENAIRLILAKSLLRALPNTKNSTAPSKRSLDFQNLNKFEEFPLRKAG